MKITLIISAYNRSDFLDIVLRSVVRQSYEHFEVIVAEDGRSTAIKEVVDSYRSHAPISITHLTQEDRGFRKCRILNQAVMTASGAFLVFIDGDCALHPQFISQYAKRCQGDVCLFGRRVMLGQSFTDKLMSGALGFAGVNLMSVVCSDSKRKENAIWLPFRLSFRKCGIVGSNFCVAKHKMLQINGFDEDFETACIGEDTDIERRLRLVGVRFVSTKFNTVQYHLHHPVTARAESYNKSFGVYSEKLRLNSHWCANGIVK
ncbi:glycosyltransferase [Desulfoluna butyratoxydans]|uniref:Nucleotide-diphospho-sugar transferases n=1 Tax=Desulfoluna butyratoxydans TaxID=231438 RepID=A0A4U8YGR0_9BACT|nr:glycosyltransferase [Desulfoluna butyratoxydans]VFQ42596.1 nucleotide-diphospho-sugar transferases [Desulfoluna butyratoxydans]